MCVCVCVCVCVGGGGGGGGGGYHLHKHRDISTKNADFNRQLPLYSSLSPIANFTKQLTQI